MSVPLSDHLHCVSTQLFVTDLQRSIDFYTKLLGFEVNFQTEDFYAGVGIGPYSIHLKHGDTATTLPSGSEDLNIVIGVTDLDACYEAVQSSDINVVQPLRQMPYGREFYIEDPDRHRLAFFDVTS